LTRRSLQTILMTMPDQNNIPDSSGLRGNAVGPSEARPMAGGRIDSVDALRGLIILLMVFVNDLGPAAPAGCTTSSHPTPTA
jgi:hypothetical protein